AGLTPGDRYIADHLRKQGKPTWLIVNKVDGHDPDVAAAEFYALGFDRVFPIAAAHGRGVQQLQEAMLGVFPEEEEEGEDGGSAARGSDGIRIAVAGRPNVGKSTLVNRLLGEERVVVFDMPGTTRDSIYIPFERRGKRYTLIDTA